MTVQTPEFLQTKKYSALRDRLTLAHGGPIQSGVWGATDLAVSTPGSGMSVNVAAGYGLIDTGNTGLYHIYNDATVAQAVTASNGTNPRIDQIILRVYDATDLASAQDAGTIEILTGTATAGATLANRTGAAALPTGSIRLADILVPASSSVVSSANIRDRRPWARGAYWSASYAGGDISIPTGFATIAASQVRLECSGAPIRCALHATYDPTAVITNPHAFQIQLLIDGVTQADANVFRWSASTTQAITRYAIYTPPAGSHLFAWASVGWDFNGALKLLANSTYPANFQFEEILRSNTNNGTS